MMDDMILKAALDACVISYNDHETPRHYYIPPTADIDDLNDFAMAIIKICLDCFDTDHEGEVEYIKFLIKRQFGIKQ